MRHVKPSPTPPHNKISCYVTTFKSHRVAEGLGERMIKELETYDWKEAFGYAGEPDTNGRADIRPYHPSSDISLAQFTREDVEEITASVEGENDGPPWRMVGRLKDGRWFYLEAGCDYTGWDCQASGSVSVAPSLSDCIRMACTEEARQILGLPMTPAPLPGQSP